MIEGYFIDPDVNCAFIRHRGDYGDGEGLAGLQMVLDDPRHRSGMYFYRDLTNSGLPAEYNYEHFQTIILPQLTVKLPKILGDCKIGWLVGSARDFKLVHQISVSTRLTPYHIERQPFRDQKKLISWLGLPDNYEIRFAN